jgi:hypothetical protein
MKRFIRAAPMTLRINQALAITTKLVLMPEISVLGSRVRMEGGFCQFAAGLAQTLSGNPNFNGTLGTGYDTPSDNAGIRVGQAMRVAGCHE